MYKLFLFILIFVPSAVFSQSVPKAYHPYDPSIDGSFIVDGKIKATIVGKYTENVDSLTLMENSTTMFDQHWVWDIVHKPKGFGNYSFSLSMGEVEYPLADFFVDSSGLYVLKLHRGARVATSSFWPEGTKLSHWQIGKYLAAIVPITNVEVPRCAKLIVKVGSGVTVDMVAIVTQKPNPCSDRKLCILTPQDMVKSRFAKDEMVLITRVPQIQKVFAIDYIRNIIRSRHPADVYDTFSLSLQYSVLLYQTRSVMDFYDTSMMSYSTQNKIFPDYTVGQVLWGYLSSRSSSRTQAFFGNMLVHVVNTGNKFCKR